METFILHKNMIDPDIWLVSKDVAIQLILCCSIGLVFFYLKYPTFQYEKNLENWLIT